MLVVTDINKTFEYTLKREKEDPNPTVFILGVLSASERAQIKDSATTYKRSSDDPNEETKLNFNLNLARVNRVKTSLKGIRTPIMDIRGKEVAFSKALVDQLSDEDIYELSAEVIRINNLSGEEEKN